jgi:siroheme synthase-like protein
MDLPVNLRLAGRRCLVVGGGAVARRKARSLANAGAVLTVVAPSIAASMPGRLVRRAFRPGDVAHALLVICATDDEVLNARVAKACNVRGILVNVVDRPSLCSVTFPATLRRGALAIAVSTGGASPAIAKAVRRELESFYPVSMARLVRIVGAARSKRPPGRTRMKFFASLITPRVLAEARAGRFDEVEARLR